MKLIPAVATSFLAAAVLTAADGPSTEPMLTSDEASSIVRRLLGPGAKITSVSHGGRAACADPGLRIEQFQVKADVAGQPRSVLVELRTHDCGPENAAAPGAEGREERREQLRTMTGFSAAQVEAAKNDLAKRLGVPPGQIQVAVAQPIEWPDASLGCPEPGKLYAQAVTKGFVIQLKAADKQYNYHGSPRRDAFFCAHSKLPTGAPETEQ